MVQILYLWNNIGIFHPAIYYVPEFRWFALAQDYYYGPWKIKKGFTYDLASIPRIARVIISNHELGFRGPLVHDFLYRNQGLPYRKVTRKEADQIFRQIMLEDKIPKWKVTLVYYSLRVGGSLAWNKHRKIN